MCKNRIARTASCRVDQTRLGGNFSRPIKYCNKLLYSKRTVHRYGSLSSLDVFGIEGNHKKGNSALCEEFRKLLGWSREGWYETTLFLKDGHPYLSSNKPGNLG